MLSPHTKTDNYVRNEILISNYFTGCSGASALTLCNPRDCSPLGSSVRGILQARIPEWVAMPSSRESSQPRDQTHVSCIAGRLLVLNHQGSPIISLCKCKCTFTIYTLCVYSFHFKKIKWGDAVATGNWQCYLYVLILIICLCNWSAE